MKHRRKDFRRVAPADRAMIDAARRRERIRLADGRVGQLTGWYVDGLNCAVIVSGRHMRVRKDSITIITSTDIGGTP